MKKILLLNMLMLFISIGINAQTVLNNHKGLQLSVRGGFDVMPNYQNNTPSIDYKGNWMAGVTANYYFNRWLGMGIDSDFLVNNPQSKYPTSNLIYSGFAINTLNLQENHITRTFAGIGPSFRYLKNDKWSLELNLRGGISNIKGGYTLLQGQIPTSPTPSPIDLNFHAGYDAKNVVSSKAAIQFNYFFTKALGLNLGIYHINHFNVPELVNSTTGIASGYYNQTAQESGNIVDLNPMIRKDACNCNISSVGVYAGIVLRFPQRSKAKIAQKCEECEQTKVVCDVCGCKLSITARDKYTKEILPETDIVIVTESGQTVNSGKTNSFGVVVFDKVSTRNYTIKGKLNATSLEEVRIAESDFKDCVKNNGVVTKEILYGDRNFIIKGRAFECNTTTPIAGINVVLENKDLAVKKSTVTDSQGNFLLQLPETGEYELYGRMEKYFSQIEKVSANDYNRDKNLFVKLEMCAEKVECGKALGLKNILFDLDKYDIKEIAKVELNRLVVFMKNNPKVQVEVGSHTDCRSSYDYNKTLSQNRANASVNYIVSQGIDRSRITGKGYGETVLLNECADGVNCTEAQHSINRRTEMKVICPEK
jgi:outer membrane protein OmpA-like peptidoglycan-associated protein